MKKLLLTISAVHFTKNRTESYSLKMVLFPNMKQMAYCNYFIVPNYYLQSNNIFFATMIFAWFTHFVLRE